MKHFDQKLWIIPMILVLHAITACGQTYVNRHYYWNEDNNQWQYYIAPRHFTSGSTTSWGLNTNNGYNGIGSPYIFESAVYVDAGAHLNIEAGVTVLVGASNFLQVQGNLLVDGTAADPVSFTGSSESPGWWRGLVVRDGGSATLHWADISYGGHWHVQDNIQRYFTVYKQGSGTLSLNNTVLRDSSGDGMMVYNNSGAVTLTGSSFHDHPQVGLRLLNSGLVTAQDCYFGDNNYGVFHEPDDAYSSQGNTYYNNASGHIGVNGGTITTDRSWYDDGVPIRITNNLTVGEGASLTVHPSAVLEFNQGMQLAVLGDLQVPGTEEQPVSFTGSSESPGWWRGLVVRDGGSATLHWADVSYGGHWNVQDNIQRYFTVYKQGSGTLSLNNTVLRNSNGDGLMVCNNSGAVTLTGSGFHDHPQVGLRLLNSGLVTAQDCYFGDNNYGVFHEPDDAYSSQGNTYYNNASGHIGVNGGTITTDRSWYDDGVPIRITNNLTVGEGASLTVHPSMVIEFNQGMQLAVLGDLQVPGTEEQPVSFTGSNESPGWWRGLVVREGGSATLHWADVSYGGHWNVQDNIQRNFNLYKQGGGTLSLNNTVLRNSNGDGLMVCNNSGAITLTSSSFNDNINSGLRLLNSGLVTAQDCYFGDNKYGVFHEPDDAYSSQGNTYYNNVWGHIGVNGGTITTDRSWYDDGVPIRITNNLTVGEGASLTVHPSAIIEFNQSLQMVVLGDLQVPGTEEQPVSFTGSSESPGWWKGLVVRDSGSATLHWADVSYGGHFNSQDNIQRNFNLYKQGSGTLSLNNTVLRNSYRDGMLVYNNSGAVTLTGSSFNDNINSGLRLLNSGLVTAQDCYFGDNKYGVFHEPDDAYSSLGNTYYNNALGHIGVNGGTITTDRSWYDDGVPIRITNNLTVGEGASLTVHPSAVLEFNQSVQMVVLGDLQVPGTEEQPVSFTGSSESPGWWRGLVVREGGSATLHWADVSYGGQFNTQDNIQRYFNLYKQGSGTLSLNNTVLRDSNGDGLMVCNNSGAITLTSSSFNDNINSGLRLLNSGLVTAQDCYFGDNNYGVFHEPDDAYSSLGNTYYNNALGHIGVNGGTITTDRSWYDDGVPIRITNNLSVGEGASLTVHPSAVLEFNQSVQMVVLGDLQVPGTEEQPVSFTGSSESPGWWKGLVVREGGSATLHWADVSYGGQFNTQDNIQYNFNLYKQGSGTLSLNNTVLRDSSGDGLILQSHTGQLFLTWNQFVSNHTGIKVRNQPESVVISGQSIMDNSAFGVINQTSAVVDARYNWWGHESGPYHATLNPSGQANAVSNGVLFNPWLEEAVFDFHVISATASENGSIDPSGAVIVFTGDSQWFFMTPNEGYYIDDVQVDGLSVGAVDAFEFHNVNQDHSIHAQFAINTYVITAVSEHEAFGSVTGEGVYNHFDMVELTATPNTGYHFVNWTEDGDIVMEGDDPAGAVYTFMAEADRSLMAHFNTSMVTVTFAVENQHGDYIDDAIITIDDMEYAPGEYVFELFAGAYQYQVYKACYLTAADEFFAASDMTVTVVLETLPGDASGDGAVNVLDVIAIANYYTDVAVDPFCYSNADVNGDDAIDVLDVIATVNLFISGKTMAYQGLLSGAAHLYLNPEGVYLESDGTLAGLQFELTGSLLQALDLKLLLSDHQMVYAVDNDVMRVMIFSLDNTPIPAGTTGLVMLNAPEGLLQFGEALAGNLNAEKVELVTHNYDATSAGLNPEDAGLEFYPNPASGELFVTFTHAGDTPAVLSLVNLHGQAVLSETLTGRGRHETVLSLEGLTPGVYMLRLDLGNRLFIEKVVIK